MISLLSQRVTSRIGQGSSQRKVYRFIIEKLLRRKYEFRLPEKVKW
ncbi:MAG: hypothetical protein ACOY90_11025 [Candidatus Zhuqueibacterota bacterium]